MHFGSLGAPGTVLQGGTHVFPTQAHSPQASTLLHWFLHRYHPWLSSLGCWSYGVQGKCLSTCHCLEGIPRRDPCASRWGGLWAFTSMPPSPSLRNQKDPWAWFGEAMIVKTVLCSESLLWWARLCWKNILLSLNFHSSKMSSLSFRRFLGLSGNRFEAQLLYHLPDTIRSGGIPATLDPCYISMSRRCIPWSAFECWWIPCQHHGFPFLFICTAFQ